MTIRSFMPAFPLDAKFLVEREHPFLPADVLFDPSHALVKQIIVNQAIETFHRKIAEGEVMTGWKDGWCDEFEDESDIDLAIQDPEISYDPTNDYYFVGSSYDDNFNDDSLDAKWAVGLEAGTITETNQELQFVTIGGTRGTLNVKSQPISGDFEAQVDFELVAYPTIDHWFLELSFRNANNIQYVGVKGTSTERYYRSNVLVNGTWGPTEYKQTTTDTAGKLRIKRTGSNFFAYYWDGSTWVQLASFSGIYTGSGSLFLWSCTRENFPPTEVHFDNFRELTKDPPPGGASFISKAHTASTAPDKALVTVIADDADDDHEIEVSRDGGTTWTKCTMDDITEFVPGSPTHVYAGVVDLSSQPTGVSMKLKGTLLDTADKLRGWDIRYL